METKYILGAVTVGIILLYAKFAKAEPTPMQEGLIISTNTELNGDCSIDECVIEKEIIIHSTFKNIGYFDKSNIVGISVNNEILKQESITLNPQQEYILKHNIILNSEIPYEICGLIIE